MSHKTGFYEGRLGIGLANDGGDGTGNPRFPLDVNGDIRLTGAILKANGEKYLGGLTKMGMNNMTELQNGNIGVGTETPTVLFDISGNTKISGDLNILGTLQMNGSTPTYSNWTNSGDDIFRDSKVTIGQGSVNTSYKLYVNGDTHINGTLSATTLSGNLAWSNITSKPTTITTTQASNITTNNAKVGITTTQASNITTNNSKVSSPWSENSGTITYNGYTAFTHYEFFKNDTNTRRYWDSNNIYWTTNNPTWEMALYNGKLGIGTTSPASVVANGNRPRLDINGNGAYGTNRIFFSDTDIADNARNWFVGPYRSDDAQFQITPTTAKGGGTPDLTKTFCVEWTGHVGICCDDPARPLQIDTDEQASIQLERKTGNGYARIGINTQFSIGEYNNLDIPWADDRSQMNAFFIEYSGGESTWNNEGAYFWMNGDYTAFSNTGDANGNGGVLHYYDADFAQNNGGGQGNGVWHINYNGTITNDSDIRLKENIRYFDDEYNISNIKEKYSQIKFCKYNYKKPLKDPSGVKRDYYGIIAQELELLFPETICQDNNGFRSFKNNVLQCITSHITANLIKENQELKTEVATLKSELATIKAHLGI